MGCCGSSEASAPESSQPPPTWGQPIKCTMRKKAHSADYAIETNDGEKWMLMDAVGSMRTGGYTYFLKHRAAGQVDAAGKPASTVLGAVNIRGECDAFSFRVCGADRDLEVGPFLDYWDGDIDWGVSLERQLYAIWTYSKRAVIYSDYEMKNQIGWLDITGSGTWTDYEEDTEVHDEDEDGEDVTRYEMRSFHECKIMAFRYKFNIFNTPMHITYTKSGGSFWSSPTLAFRAANAFAPDVPLFAVTGDGKRNCEIETFPNSDPVSTLLAAFAISCQLDPKDFGKDAEVMCLKHIQLGMWPGTSNFHGMTEADFEAKFAKYPAPVPEVFAQAVASFVPPAQPLMTVVAQPVAQQPPAPASWSHSA